MTTRLIALVVAASLATHADHALGLTYTTLDAPFAGTTINEGTYAFGVSGNKVVGIYRDAALQTHGFLYDGANYTTLDDPLAGGGTYAHAISGNLIVGYYFDAAEVSHGFIFDGTSWTTLDDPLATQGTMAVGISGNKIVGSYSTGAATNHGFIYDGTNWTTIDHPLADGRGTNLNAIDGNLVVGSYEDEFGDSNSHSFEYDGSSLIPIPDAPGTKVDFGYSYVTGISGQNLVGFFNDDTPAANNHAFLYDGTNWTIFDAPLGNYQPTSGSSTTTASAIDGNTIVGEFETSADFYGFQPLHHGFIATIPEPSSLSILLFAAALLSLRRRQASAWICSELVLSRGSHPSKNALLPIPPNFGGFCKMH